MTRTKITTLSALFLIINQLSVGQENNRAQKLYAHKTQAYLEAGGAGGFYSVGMRQKVLSSKNTFSDIQLGISYLEENSVDYIHIPFSFNHLMSLQKCPGYLEVGVGVTFQFRNEQTDLDTWGTENKSLDYLPIYTGRIGYRYQKTTSPIGFNITFVPSFVAYDSALDFTPWGGVGLSYSLN